MDQISYLLSRGVDTIYPSKEALEQTLRSGKKLRLYQGIDPTGNQLHLGHAVALRKLRQFQELGHQVIFLIGGFTATIGDPTGKLSARTVLTKEQVYENAMTYKEQAQKILRFEGDNAVEIKNNDEWLGTMSARELLEISHLVSFQQMIERDMFQERLKQHQDIYANEFFYPLLQAYDSVAMDVDVEIGGTDQMFNMMMGRKLMKKMRDKEKFVLTVPLLTDAAGKKIGKSEGNAIGLADPANELYAKIMSLGDEAIIPCFTLLTDTPDEELRELKEAMEQGSNPMEYKKQLAFTITTWLNSQEEAQVAQEAFESVFQNHDLTKTDIPTFTTQKTEWDIVDLLTATKMIESKGEGKRLLEQKAVEINGTTITNRAEPVKLSDGDIIKAGKLRFTKIVVQ